jgi:DNA-binding CsgD family transcriptional regulator
MCCAGAHRGVMPGIDTAPSTLRRPSGRPTGSVPIPVPVLRGRQAEGQQLERLVEAVRRGASQVLVLSGEAGIGKSALLDHLVAAASGCRVVRATGVRTEAELPLAGLHQLCTPLLHRLDRIPAPQGDAVGTAFGLRAGPAPDRFLLRLGVLSLLTEAAAERPLVCVVDDAQWLDPTSTQALAFAARRLVAEPVALVFALRNPADNPSLAGLPQLVLGGLGPDDARDLLAAAIPGPLDERVRDRIVAETRGNPLALLGVSRSSSYVELAGGFGPPGAQELAGRIEDNVRRLLAGLPSEARRLLFAAAVEPTGDPALIRRAASRLGVTVDEHDRSAFAGLLRWDTRVTFRHSLTRSAVYRAASPEEIRAAHRVLADVTDPGRDADRRAWHRAHSISGPDEDVAAELDRSAGRAQARGGLAAAAAFLERATHLTPGGEHRVRRALAAARAALQIGAYDSTLVLLAVAEDGPLDELQRARTDLLRAQLACASCPGEQAAPLLLAAARRIEPLDPESARGTYLEAVSAAVVAGCPTGRAGVVRIAAAARRAPAPRQPSPVDLLLDALTTRLTEGYAAAAPLSRRALRALAGRDLPAEAALGQLRLASAIAADLWDDESWDVLAGRHLTAAREAGALGELALALDSRIVVEVLRGTLPTAAALVDEANAVTDRIATGVEPAGALWLAAWRGREPDALRLSRDTAARAAARGGGTGPTVAHAANALLYNGLGRYERAIAEARRAAESAPELAAVSWGLAELVEAAARLGDRGLAADAVARLAERTSASGTEWALGIEARSRALASDYDSAEPLYREAIERLSRTTVRAELARARLLYGEWLRRSRRRSDAREQLRAAEQTFTATGAEAFAERARRELAAAGEKARRRTSIADGQLTAREAQIARMARDGLSNPEIGRRLFLSPRTVEYHLGHVFAKLGITSRHEVDRALTGAFAPGQPA